MVSFDWNISDFLKPADVATDTAAFHDSWSMTESESCPIAPRFKLAGNETRLRILVMDVET